MIVTGIVLAQGFPPDNNGGSVGACELPVSKPNTLFDIGDPTTKKVSHLVTVGPDEVYVLSAQGIGDADELVVETVTGCGLGDLFECHRDACGCPMQIDCNTHRLVLRYTGRYRLRVTAGTAGAYRIMAHRMSGSAFTEVGMACGCSSGKTGAAAVDSIIGSPSAMAGLCQALGPCIENYIGESLEGASGASEAPPSAPAVGNRWYNTRSVTVAGVPPDAWATWTGAIWAVDTNQPFTIDQIPPGSIDGSHIRDGSIGPADLAPNSVNGTHIQDGSIGPADLAPNSVNGTHIQDGAVGPTELAPDSVNGTHIQNGAVGPTELAANAVNGTHIQNGAVGPTELAANAVNGGTHIQPGTIPGSALTPTAVVDALGCTPQCINAKNTANGYAPLDARVKVPAVNLPYTLSTANPTAAAGSNGDIWFKYV